MVWLIALFVIAAVAVCVAWLRKRVTGGDERRAPADGECCGQHAVCERDSLLAGVSRRVEYYDDEELDRYRGVAADGLPGWCRSLQLRGIELPDQLKEEVLLIVGEHRSAATRK